MSQKLIEIKNQLQSSLHDSSKPWTSVLRGAEKKTGIDRLYIFLGELILDILFLEVILHYF